MPAQSKTGTWRILPIAGWLPFCSGATIRADILAGLALAALLVPQGIAYAGIAGVPPQAGLFSAAAGLFIYALFGSSRHLAVSATSGSAAMLAALVAPLAQGDAGKYMALASATAIAAGSLLLIGAIFRLGFVSEFISKPVLKGFVFGLALTIMVGQVPMLIGVAKGKGDFFEKLWHLVTSAPQANYWTLVVGVSALAIAFGVGTLFPRVPSALVVFVLGIWAIRQFGLDGRGVEIVGAIQGGMPSFLLPGATRQEWLEIATGAIGIVLIMYAEALAAGRTFAARNKYDIDANQELMALGASNLVSGISGGIVVGGGMSGIAANAAGGARTQISSIVASLLSVLTLAYLLPLIHHLPEAVLAAIVIHAVARLADVSELRRFARLRTGSIWAALAALVGVLTLGILKGLVLAICLTLVAVMKKLSTPQASILGRLAGTGVFVDIRNHPEAEPIPGLLIYRPNGIVFFANANRVFQGLRRHISRLGPELRAVIINFEAVAETDVTSVDMLEQLRGELQSVGIDLYLARVPDPVYELLARSGFMDRHGEGRVFRGVDLAVNAFSESISSGTRMQ